MGTNASWRCYLYKTDLQWTSMKSF
jgi:hypothetical protein